MGEKERLSSHATAAANDNKDDNARGGSLPWEDEEEHRSRRNIVPNETNDIDAPADSST